MNGVWSKNSYEADCLVDGNTAFVVSESDQPWDDEERYFQVWYHTYSSDGGVVTETWIGTTFSREAAMNLAEITSELMEAASDRDD